jgi:hypothetical protein
VLYFWCSDRQAERSKIKEKLRKVRAKEYLVPGAVRSLTSFFTVPKGTTDVRIVYNGTKSGLNDCLWAPWFRLPTVEQHLRAVVPGSFLADIDVGEQFLNFMLHRDVRPYAGVDLTAFFPDELATGDAGACSKRTLWVQWTRCGMSFKPSPYNAGQAMLHAEEYLRGNPLDPQNPFHYDVIVLNLPGQPDYTPAKPWVFKFRSRDGNIANDFFVYVDDVRTTGFSAEECWRCTRVVASRYNFLGLQDAARKRRGPSCDAGPWAWSTVLTSGGGVFLTVTVERWQKAKQMIQWIHDGISSGTPLLHKTLESYRGFLVYVSRTYPYLVPYLKGIHLTLDSWRPNRDAEGWKVGVSVELDAALGELFHTRDLQPDKSAPSHVTPVPRLVHDICALRALFEPGTPPKWQIRPTSAASAVYGFGDASGSGFGTTILIHGHLHYRHGQWSTSYSEASSNYRELSNLVIGIEEATAKGLLTDCELFMFTDNSTAEAAFHKGTSSSKPLFDLVLRLRMLQLHHGLHLHVIHVAGTRMQYQGTDGLSRGSTDAGVLQGDDMLSFIPLHLSAADRHPPLAAWIQSWYSDDPYSWLQPFDWFNSGHTAGRNVWCPPPAAADVALEQLAIAIHKRPKTQHLVLIPRLLSATWRRLLEKPCDIIFTVPLGSDVWPSHHFEPLIVGIYFPLTRHRPWRLRDTALLDDVASQLSNLPRDAFNWGGDILRKLLRQTQTLDTMSPRMARELLLRN